MVTALRNQHHWTDEEKGIVRCGYRGTRRSAEAIALYLSLKTGERITKCAVKGQVQQLGVATVVHRIWTPEEDEKLIDLIHRFSPRKVAKMMGRGENSINIRAKRLNQSKRVRNGWFTKAEVCEILGVDHHLVQTWIDGGQLKASWHNGHKPSNKGSATWHIDEQDLKDFLRRYPAELTGRNVDLITIVDILAGVDYKCG